MSVTTEHVPVLVEKVVSLLRPCLSVGTVIDATAGGGGHLRALAQEMQKLIPINKQRCRLIGIDVDATALRFAQSRLSEFGCTFIRGLAEISSPVGCNRLSMILLIQANYVDMAEVVERLGIRLVSGVLMDLGLSCYQLQRERGFSFEADGPLDMRFDQQSSSPTAREILQKASINELYSWFKVYADEPLAGRISRQIYAARKDIRTTGDLVKVVEKVIPPRRLKKTLARIFQALRIVVNNEIENLQLGLRTAIRLLMPGGRLVVICYQSGEDRCFKEMYREHRGELLLLNRKPLYPDADEVFANPRARSARLRAVEKTEAVRDKKIIMEEGNEG